MPSVCKLLRGHCSYCPSHGCGQWQVVKARTTSQRQGYCPSHGCCPSQWQVVGVKADASQWQVVQVRAVACQWQGCMSVASQRHGYLSKLLAKGKLSKARLLVQVEAACQG